MNNLSERNLERVCLYIIIVKGERLQRLVEFVWEKMCNVCVDKGWKAYVDIKAIHPIIGCKCQDQLSVNNRRTTYL